MAKQKRDRVHDRHRMVLDSIPGIIAEQCRLYRLWTNGRIKVDEMSKGMGGLSQIRTSIESLPAEQQPDAPPTAISIIEVPSGMFVTEDEWRKMSGMAPLRVIEHFPQPSSEPEIEATSPAPIPEPQLEQPSRAEFDPRVVQSAGLRELRNGRG